MNNSNTSSPKLKPQEELNLLKRALDSRDWKILIPYRKLLYQYQKIVIKDNAASVVRQIATIGSHRAGNHLFCDSAEKCATVEKFIADHLQPPLAHEYLEVSTFDHSTTEDQIVYNSYQLPPDTKTIEISWEARTV